MRQMPNNLTHVKMDLKLLNRFQIIYFFLEDGMYNGRMKQIFNFFPPILDTFLPLTVENVCCYHKEAKYLIWIYYVYELRWRFFNKKTRITVEFYEMNLKFAGPCIIIQFK